MDILIGILAFALFGGFIYRYIDIKKKGLELKDFWKFKKQKPDEKKDPLKELSDRLKEGGLR